METHYINNQHYTLEEFEKVIDSNCRVELGESAKEAVEKCYQYLHKSCHLKIKSSTELIRDSVPCVIL